MKICTYVHVHVHVRVFHVHRGTSDKLLSLEVFLLQEFLAIYKINSAFKHKSTQIQIRENLEQIDSY